MRKHWAWNGNSEKGIDQLAHIQNQLCLMVNYHHQKQLLSWQNALSELSPAFGGMSHQLKFQTFMMLLICWKTVFVIGASTPTTRGDCKRVWLTSSSNRGMPRLGGIPSLTVDPQHHIPGRELVHFTAGYLNNDIEGWHNALNRRASCRSVLAFDVLIQLLYQEARLVEVQMRLVADCKLTRIQRKKYCELQA